MMPNPSKKATRAQTKIHNTRLVLKTIYDRRQISRADIARATKLTRPTVSDAVSRLIDDGLVTDVGRGPSTGGKQLTLLSLVPDSRQVIAVDIAGNSVFRGAVVDLQGRILQRADVPVNGVTGDDALKQVYALTDSLMDQATNPVLGIGIGSPGLINTRDGIVCRSVNLGWEEFPLHDLLTQRYSEPIYIANDSQVAALAEFSFGNELTSPNLVVIKIGRGIGAGIISNGDPYYGDGFGAGEIGHVVVDAAGETCTCGNAGCLETSASVPAILRKSASIAAAQPNSDLGQAGEVDWPTVIAAFQAGDPAITALVEEVVASLGMAIANLIGTLNIFQIVLAGRLSDIGQPLLDAISSEAQRRVLPSMAAETKIRFASVPADIGILGSAALLLKYELGII